MAEASAGYHVSRAGRLARWVFWYRPASYWDVIVYHLPLALSSAMALLLPQIVSLQRLPLIPCTFLHLTGIPCPFCGFTRSLWAISEGHWLAALWNCPLAYGVFFFILVLFVWNAAALLFRRVVLPGSVFRATAGRGWRVAIVVCFLFLLNWGYRLSVGLT